MPKYKLHRNDNIYLDMARAINGREYAAAYRAHNFGGEIPPYTREIISREASDATDETLECKRYKLYQLLSRRYEK